MRSRRILRWAVLEALLLVAFGGCGPLALDLGEVDVQGAPPGATGGVVASSTGGDRSSYGGDGGGSSGGDTGVGGSNEDGNDIPDSCPLDVVVDGDCSDYPAEANCKLGEEYFHCEHGQWLQLVGHYTPAPDDLRCPVAIAAGTSCGRFAPNARCCTSEGACYECDGGTQIWTS